MLRISPLRSPSPLRSTDAILSCLSPENEVRIRRHLAAQQTPGSLRDGGSPAAGILLPLLRVGADPSLLLTLRSNQLPGKHRGDVSFPGGKREPGDRDIVSTALREAREELGIEVPPESVWGTLRPVRERSGILVVPVLAYLGNLELSKLRPSVEEVEDVFTIPIQQLYAAENRAYTRFRVEGAYAYTLPVFLNAKYRVWGLTALVIDSLLSLLFPGTHRTLFQTVNRPVGKLS